MFQDRVTVRWCTYADMFTFIWVPDFQKSYDVLFFVRSECSVCALDRTYALKKSQDMTYRKLRKKEKKTKKKISWDHESLIAIESKKLQNIYGNKVGPKEK